MAKEKTGCSGIALGIFGGFLLIALFIGGCALLPLFLPVAGQIRENAEATVEQSERNRAAQSAEPVQEPTP